MPTIKRKKTETKKTGIKSKKSPKITPSKKSPSFSLSDKSFSLSKSEPKIRLSKKTVKKAIPLAIGATALAGLLYTGNKFNKAFKNQYPSTKISETVIDRRKDTRIGYLKELLKDIKQKYYIKDKNYKPLVPGNNEFTEKHPGNIKLLLKKDGRIVRNSKGKAVYVKNPLFKTSQQDKYEVESKDIIKLKTRYNSLNDFIKEKRQEE